MNEEKTRNHVSFSELKIWNECPYKHKLVYIDKIKEFLGNEHTAFGTAIHEVCEKAVLKEISLSKKDLVECFKQSFLKEIQSLIKNNVNLNKKLIKDMKLQAEDLVTYIIPELKKEFGNYKVISAEEELHEIIDDQNKKYKGFIDLVIKTDDGKYHIIDWKTCSWGWDSRRKTDRMTTYQLVYYKHFFSKKYDIDAKNIEVYFALLKRTAKSNKAEIFKVTSGNKKVENSLKLLNKAIYNIEHGNFLKNRLSCTSGYGCEFYNTKHCSR